MDILSIYIATFFVVFLILPAIYFSLRFILWLILECCGCSSTYRSNQERAQSHGEQNTHRRVSNWGLFYDRQGNIFTISDETTGNAGTNRYPDFFYLEPNGDEAARIRAQLEKDDKDLPSYDDVMRMTSLPSTPGTPSSGPIPGNATNIATVDNLGPPPSPPPPTLTIPVPPYSEVDPNSATTSSNSQSAASTSRGASITIPTSASITSV